MQSAIKKAIEGGYYEQNAHMQHKGTSIAVCFPGTDRIDTYISKEEILLDPLFWQALGKAMWDEYVKGIAQHHEWRSPDVFYRKAWGKDGHKYKEEKVEHEPWLKMMHRFIDHLAEGKDADSFFNELLK